jgi:hypothetical protein
MDCARCSKSAVAMSWFPQHVCPPVIAELILQKMQQKDTKGGIWPKVQTSSATLWISMSMFFAPNPGTTSTDMAGTWKRGYASISQGVGVHSTRRLPQAEDGHVAVPRSQGDALNDARVSTCPNSGAVVSFLISQTSGQIWTDKLADPGADWRNVGAKS